MSETNSVYAAYSGNTHLFGGNGPYVEEMYENYLANPGSVPDSWREYFDALQHVPAVDGSNAKDVPHLPVINAFAERAKQGGTKVVMASADAEMGRKRTAVQQLIAAYRNVGQRWADLDPLKRTERDDIRLTIIGKPREGASNDLIDKLGLNDQHFDRVLQLFSETLEELNVSQKEHAGMLEVLQSMRDAVMGR